MQIFRVMCAAIDRVESITERSAATVVPASSSAASEGDRCTLALVSQSATRTLTPTHRVSRVVVQAVPETASSIRRVGTGARIVDCRSASS